MKTNNTKPDGRGAKDRPDATTSESKRESKPELRPDPYGIIRGVRSLSTPPGEPYNDPELGRT